MQAIQNWLNAGNMALLDTIYLVGIGTLVAVLYVWWKFGARFVLPSLTASVLGIASGIFSAHFFYLITELPHYIAKNYIWYPLGFSLTGYLIGHMVSVFIFAFLISFFAPRNAEVMVITVLISLPLLLPSYFKLIVFIIGICLLVSNGKYRFAMETIALMLFSITAVVYNVMWIASYKEIMAFSIGGIIVSTILAIWVVYRGDSGEL